MKYISSIHLLIGFFATATSYAQTLYSSDTLTDKVDLLYKNDADRLAIRYTFSTNSRFKDSVVIDKRLHSEFLRALTAVYKFRYLAASDTVVRLLNIHTYNPGLNSIILKVDSNLVWMSNIRHNTTPYGDLTLDFLLAKYHFKKVYYSGLFQPALVVFRTELNSNLVPLAKQMKSIYGVSAAEPDYLYGDGNDISGMLYPDSIFLTYSFGWENCPTGCEKRRFWKFKILNKGEVYFVESYGDALESSLKIKVEENPTVFKNVNVYANPAKEKLYIEFFDKQASTVHLNLMNAKGDVLQSINKPSAREEMNMILLPNGVYYLRLHSAKEHKVYKIIKK